MTTVSSGKFKKKAAKLQKSIAEALKIRLTIFQEDPYNLILNNHALRGSMFGYRSINITGDYRVIYEEITKDIALLTDIGTHSNLYKK